MNTEYRFTMSVTFGTAEDRDAAYEQLKKNLDTYHQANAGTVRAADMTREEYLVSAPTLRAKIV